MKTKTYTHRIARISVFAAAFFLLTAVAPAKSNDRIPESSAGMSSAIFSLDVLNDEIESSVRFIPPASLDVAAEYREMEINAALESLEEFNAEIENEVRFEAPAVDVKSEAAEFEVNGAVESLDQLNSEIEKSIRYEAPAAE